jgi:hypothetical protein
MSAQAYDMHAEWRIRDPRLILERCRANGGTVTPYGKSISRFGSYRSYVVSWPSEGCEGHLYVLRVNLLPAFERHPPGPENLERPALLQRQAG